MGFEQLAELKKQLTKESAQQAGAARRRPKDTGGSKARQAPVDPVVLVIGKLQKRFPATFPKSPAPKIPLKVGILEDVLAHVDQLGLSEAEIRDAISTWCRGSRYWACLTVGATRVDLAGAPAGQVTARDSAFARSRTKGAKAPRTSGGSSAPETRGNDADPVAA
jgi:ProP effector